MLMGRHKLSFSVVGMIYAAKFGFLLLLQDFGHRSIIERGILQPW